MASFSLVLHPSLSFSQCSVLPSTFFFSNLLCVIYVCKKKKEFHIFFKLHLFSQHICLICGLVVVNEKNWHWHQCRDAFHLCILLLYFTKRNSRTSVHNLFMFFLATYQALCICIYYRQSKCHFQCPCKFSFVN